MAGVGSSLNSLCTPAMVYLVFSVISILFMLGQASIISMVVKVFFVGVWTWFLNFLCNKNLKGVAWFLVILPFIFIVLILLFAADLIANMGAQAAQPPTQGQPTQTMQPGMQPRH